MSSNELRSDAESSPSEVELRARARGIGDRLKIGQYFAIAFGFLFLVTLSCVLLIGAVIWNGQSFANPTATMAFAASIQVVFGMTTGYVCIFMGLLMTWFGVESAYSFQGSAASESSKGDVVIKSASPGLLFAVGGMILIVLSLYKTIVYEEAGNRPTYVAPTQRSKALPVPDPVPPVEIDR